MIERLHPGVYVIELPCEAKAIDGVPTPTPGPPEWTDDNAHDPGVTLLSLLVYALDALPHRAHPHVNGATAGMPPGSGVVGGLAVHRCNEGTSFRVVVSPGMAVGVDGQAIDRDSTSVRRHVPQH